MRVMLASWWAGPWWCASYLWQRIAAQLIPLPPHVPCPAYVRPGRFSLSVLRIAQDRRGVRTKRRWFLAGGGGARERSGVLRELRPSRISFRGYSCRRSFAGTNRLRLDARSFCKAARDALAARAMGDCAAHFTDSSLRLAPAAALAPCCWWCSPLPVVGVGCCAAIDAGWCTSRLGLALVRSQARVLRAGALDTSELQSESMGFSRNGRIDHARRLLLLR